MSKHSFHIIGHVIDQNARRGVDELPIEPEDKDSLVDELVGSSAMMRKQQRTPVLSSERKV